MTVDGYNLTVFRIPHGLNNTAATKGPVFVQHVNKQITDLKKLISSNYQIFYSTFYLIRDFYALLMTGF